MAVVGVQFTFSSRYDVEHVNDVPVIWIHPIQSDRATTLIGNMYSRFGWIGKHHGLGCRQRERQQQKSKLSHLASKVDRRH